MIILFRIFNILFIFCDIFFKIFLFGFIWTFIAKKIYLKQLIIGCESVGLKYVPSEYYGDFGYLEGILKTYKVRVEFESKIITSGYSTETLSDTLITVKSQVPKFVKNLELKKEKPLRIPDQGTADFLTGNFNFNSIFKTRRGDPWIANQFKEITELSDKFVTFYLKWIFRLSDFNVNIASGEQCFECRLNYGRPWTQYISLKKLSNILNELIFLISFFDKCMKEKNWDFFEKIQFGPSKSTDDITIDDLKQFPIWVNDSSGESLERPIINLNNVTEKLVFEFATIDVLIYCEEFELYGAAYYVEENDSITSLFFWKDNEWQDIDNFKKNRKSIKVKCIPGIKGKKDLEYGYDLYTYTGKPLI